MSAMAFKIARDQCKKVRGLWPGVPPFCPAGTLCHRIAVGKKDRQCLGRILNAHMKDAHDIGAVRIKCDFAKPFGFALGTVDAV